MTDWLSEGRDGVAARTISRDLSILKPVLAIVGNKSLRDLTTHDVRRALTVLAGEPLNLHGHACAQPLGHGYPACRGRGSRPPQRSRAGDASRRNGRQAIQVAHGRAGVRCAGCRREVQASRLHRREPAHRARTEEMRALRWDHVDLDNGTMAVWRSVRQSGDTKTEKSRRTLALPRKCVDALTEHRKRQAEDRLRAGPLWQDNGLVFATSVGTAMNANNVIRDFRSSSTRGRRAAQAGYPRNCAPRSSA